MKQFKLLKNLALLVAVLLLSSNLSVAQLNGTYTIGGTTPSYTTLSAAIAALNSQGVSGPVTFLIRDGAYTGTGWQGSIGNIVGASNVNRITFRSQSGNKTAVTINVAGTTNDNYIVRLNNARFITIRDLTFINTNASFGRVFDFVGTSSFDSIANCTITGAVSVSSANSMALIYAASHTGTDNVLFNNLIQNGGTSVYWWGISTTTTSGNLRVIGNTISSANSNYYGLYTYYTNNMIVRNNNLTRTGTGIYYSHLIYYNNNAFDYSNNVVNATSNSTMYASLYYLNYINTNSADTVSIRNNVYNMENTTGLNYVYNRYIYNCDHSFNRYNIISTTGGNIIDGLYYVYNSKSNNNEVTVTSTSTGYCNYYDMYYGFDSKSYSNKVTVNNSLGTSGYNNMYLLYFGQQSEMYNNEYVVNNNSGYCYFYAGYTSGNGKFRNNSIRVNTISGIIYGVRPQYGGCDMFNNTFKLYSTSGTVFGLYPNYMSAGHVYNNVFDIKTTGSVYNLYTNYSTGGVVANNTFHNNSANSVNYLLYDYNLNAGSMKIVNNIFSRTNPANTMLYSYNLTNTVADYNLYYTPGNTTFESFSPSSVSSILHNWRKVSNRDLNSLIYEPTYVDAVNGDFRILASSPNAWAVNGRGIHDTARSADILGIPRAAIATQGVPDLGAYEVTPTSTPPVAIAMPASPIPNGTQVFTFGQDTVATIAWGATVPNTYILRQYTGLQATPMAAGVGRMFFYVAGTPSTLGHSYKPAVFYKDPWIGTVPTESEAVIARSSNNGAWEGFNFSNAATNTIRNILSPANMIDSVGSFTGVQNGRIGIRCVENPKGIIIKNITAIAADIDWSPVFNPIGYQVVFKTVKVAPTAAEWATGLFATSNSVAATGLDEDTKYFLYVRSVCGVRDTSGYSLDSFVTLITCHMPDARLTDVNTNRAVVYWNVIKTAHKYEYAITTMQSPPAVGTSINKTSMLLPFLDNGATYYIHVRAHCSSIYDKSDWTTVSFKTWTTGINNVSGDASALSVYPNPVNSELIITIGGGSTNSGTLSIVDMTGKVLKVQSVTGSKLMVNVAELPAGIYVAQYTSDTQHEQIKFNKQ